MRAYPRHPAVAVIDPHPEHLAFVLELLAGRGASATGFTSPSLAARMLELGGFQLVIVRSGACSIADLETRVWASLGAGAPQFIEIDRDVRTAPDDVGPAAATALENAGTPFARRRGHSDQWASGIRALDRASDHSCLAPPDLGRTG